MVRSEDVDNRYKNESKNKNQNRSLGLEKGRADQLFNTGRQTTSTWRRGRGSSPNRLLLFL